MYYLIKKKLYNEENSIFLGICKSYSLSYRL